MGRLLLTQCDAPGKLAVMKLGIVSHKEFEMDGQGIVSQGGFGRSVEIWEQYFDEVSLLVPVYRVPKAVGYAIQSKKFTIQPLPAYRSRLEELLLLPRIWRLLRERMATCDVLQIRVGSPIALAALLLVRRMRKPAFLLVHGDPLAVRRTHGKLWGLFSCGPITWATEMLTRKYSKGHLCFVTGEALRQLYQREGSEIYLIPDTTIYESELAVSLRPARETVRLLFVGRLSREKGIHFLLQALPKTKHYAQLSLDVVGSGPEEGALRELAHELNLGEKVRFHGYVPQGSALREFFDTADLLLVPSLSEGWPKVILEAFARGLPVVASNVGGIPGLVQDGVTGLLVPPASPEAIAEAIDTLIVDSTLHQNLAAKGIETAHQFTVEAVTQRQVQLLNRRFGLQLHAEAARV